MKAYILADPDILNDKTKYVEGWGWDHTKWLLEEWPTYVRSSLSFNFALLRLKLYCRFFTASA